MPHADQYLKNNIYCFHLGTVTACEIRMTDGSLETVTKPINDPSMTSYTADSE